MSFNCRAESNCRNLRVATSVIDAKRRDCPLTNSSSVSGVRKLRITTEGYDG